MGRSLYETSPAAAAIFRKADEVLAYGLSEICFNGPKETLDATEHSQPALLVTSVAALAAMDESDPSLSKQAEICAGLSLGEYTAMVFAGAMSFDDGLRVVRERGLAMQEAADAQPSGMVSILGLEDEQVAALCDEARLPGEVLQIANLLCPGNVAVSGHAASCFRVAELAPAKGAMRAVPLAVAGAFHTSIMQSAESRLARVLETVTLKSPRIPVISNVDGQAHFEPEELRRILVRQVCSPVQWSQSVRNMMANGATRFVEIGTGKVLRGLMKRIDRSAACSGYPE
jgi:[acyl-carrier-protein] S-malonyltransferase